MVPTTHKTHIGLNQNPNFTNKKQVDAVNVSFSYKNRKTIKSENRDNHFFRLINILFLFSKCLKNPLIKIIIHFLITLK